LCSAPDQLCYRGLAQPGRILSMRVLSKPAVRAESRGASRPDTCVLHRRHSSVVLRGLSAPSMLPSSSRTGLSRRSRRRARSRGAALFIVVLVVTLLLGIGAFAARSALLANTSSGFDRQMTQSRYVSEYALMIAVAKLSNGNAQVYLGKATNATL